MLELLKVEAGALGGVRVSGALVGGASLKADSFAGIVRFQEPA